MTKKQRVLAALAGGPTDRVPVAAWRHFPGKDYTAEAQVESFVSFQEEYDWDFMKMMFRNSFPLEDWGCLVQAEQVPYGYYLPARFAVRMTGDWKTLEVLDPLTGTLGEMIEVVKGVTRRVNADLLKLATVFCPLMVARQLAGEQQLLTDLRGSPQVLHQALEVITETVLRFCKALLEAGAEGIFFATQSNTPDFMEKAEYAEFGHRYSLRVLDSLDGLSEFTMLHVCREHPRFDEFADYPVHAINWDDRITEPSLALARARTDKCLIGGIDKEGVLRNGTPEQVRNQVRDAVASAGREKLIIAPGCGIPVDCPKENLHALRQAVEELG